MLSKGASWILPHDRGIFLKKILFLLRERELEQRGRAEGLVDALLSQEPVGGFFQGSRPEPKADI